uniref:MRG domain-containing protein n=1 Tax=Caenorhabditis tropicalis TaxID=1561998 RepID=A0A1I7UXJ8_9PELO
MATNRVMTRSLSRSLNFMQSATTVAVIHHITLSVQETPSDVEPLQNVSDQKPKRPKQARSRNEVPRKPSTEANGNASLQNSLPSKRTRSKIKVEVESKPILSNQQLQATIVSQEPNIIAPIGNRKRPASKVVKKKNARTRNTVPKKRKEVCESEEEDEFLNSENESDIDETSDEDDSSSITKRKRYSIDDSENDDDDDSDGEFFNQKIRALIAPPVSHPPRQFYEMQRIWSEISSRLTDDMLSSYKRTLLRLIVGRSSCLHPIRRLMPNLPADLFGAHERLYNLLCDASGAYPFKYHKGSTLISRHSLADTSQIGAQIMIECLDKKIVPFDILNEMPVLSRIETYVRIGIKDMLEEIVEQLPPDRNNITVADLKESLSSRLLG